MKKNKIISAISTFLVMLVVFLVLISFGYDPPDPPPIEEGVEINLGDSDFGSGNAPEPVSQPANNAPPASQQQVATQHAESPISMPSNPNQGNVVNPAAQEQPRTENKEPELNRNALFPGNRNKSKGDGSEGVTTGDGNQGKPNGNPQSTNYTGDGGSGRNYSLKGRSAVTLPEPVYKSNSQGTVVVRIWVDQDGRVVRAEYEPLGSNTAEGYLVQQAVSAALKARFNASSNAPEKQKGTITYVFKI